MSEHRSVPRRASLADARCASGGAAETSAGPRSRTPAFRRVRRASPNFFRLPDCIVRRHPDFYAGEAIEGTERLRQLAHVGRADPAILVREPEGADALRWHADVAGECRQAAGRPLGARRKQ